ncbi:hypothetical protein A3A79_05380 [Candidatus Gottesmanbacteria bacterium RIFCSPLOWO2_01_FULL_43_11b]|uniref:DUF2795 domain-containing protein n=1 Tax=Candidatus Gottesmanbacteria bacterium RIFCSPLOWO2_01_FULL_43_11b TaxID=1798392 RepID=A0A1F6AIW5_9BACT|nr:MAG: hypothetical protein A3A79_05380 [Candidatus Gottesmanbacteria bacterium RIFCSPLOWO2_01_FULL_43_11b]
MQNVPGVTDHLKTHIGKWPATKAELVAACNALSDFTPEDKAEFESKLPDGTYNSADDVMRALGMEASPPVGGTPPSAPMPS